ncbi:MAG: fumarylacetoacetate hydrolase family protein [Verrucomicrobia subdivision 3 bacterium]|nr:fumarylacetoacetate hydrolase family protein [Limisphaerales bacterium]
MKLCRFQTTEGHARVGLVYEDTSVVDLGAAGVERLEPLLETENLAHHLGRLVNQTQTRYGLRNIKLLPPIERQEVWAAGVTYQRSKTARMEESKFGASAYDKVYEANRPELFFKSVPEKVVAPNDPVGIRKDSAWSVPEPELALVFNSKGRVVGYTIGNDMSSRDIEGENLLYLPQAKIYDRSCALGPFLKIGALEAEARAWTIHLRVQRGTKVVFQGETSVSQIKRRFEELGSYLFKSQRFPHGAVLLTGTGIVPPDNFALQAADVIRISISGIGVLENPVSLV